MKPFSEMSESAPSLDDMQTPAADELQTPAAPPFSVLHVIAPSAFGGAESVVATLASGLAGRGHSVHLAVVLDREAQPPPVLTRLSASGVSLTTLRLPPRGYLKEIRGLAQLIADLDPDIVHTHGYRADVTGGLAARAKHVPVVSTAHGETRVDTRDRIYEWLQRRAYRRFDAIVAVSRPLATRLKRSLGGRVPIHTVPNAWAPPDALLDRAGARSRLSLGDRAFVVGWVGRLSWEKGPDLLVDAAIALRDLELSFCILGEGPQRDVLVQRAREEELDFHWAGAVPEAWLLFPAFDLFVLSSRREGTPMVLFEAIHAGVPIVASAVGGVPDVLGTNACWLVPPADAGALARAVREAHADAGEREARARVARSVQSSESDPGVWVRRHERLYAGLLGIAEISDPL